MRELLTGSFAPKTTAGRRVRLLNWNIERGVQLPQIEQFLAQSNGDILTLQEVDWNASRSGQVDVAAKLAQALRLDYVLGIAFEEVTQGADAWQGQATFSRFGLSKPRVLHFRQQSNFWKPRWWVPNTPPFQERLGGRIALVTEMPLGKGFFVLYNLHLESRGPEELRSAQLREVVDDASQYSRHIPIVIAGDLNTKHQSSPCLRLLQSAGFQDVIGDPRRFTTNRGGRLAKLFIDGALDWIWVRGPLQFSQGRMHTDLPKASDHWPLSVELEWA